MTAQQTLRAALEKHGLSTHSIAMIADGDVPPLRKAILEAMQQHRAEAIEEVEKWANELSIAMALDSEDLSQMDRLKAKLAALKDTG